jgi:hypothetical protein
MFSCSRSTLIVTFMIQPRLTCRTHLVDLLAGKSMESISTLRKFSPDVAAMLNDLTEARPLIRTELNVKTHDGGQLLSGFVDDVATLDVELEDFIRRFSLHTRKSKAKQDPSSNS